MNEGRCDERLKVRVEESTWLTYTVARQNKLEIPRDKDEVNKREIHECDGRAHDPDTMVAPLTPKPPRQGRRRPFFYENDIFFFSLHNPAEGEAASVFLSLIDANNKGHAYGCRRCN